MFSDFTGACLVELLKSLVEVVVARAMARHRLQTLNQHRGIGNGVCGARAGKRQGKMGSVTNEYLCNKNQVSKKSTN